MPLMLLCTNVQAKWYQHSFDVMGTRAHVEFYLDSEKLKLEEEEQTSKQLIAEVKAELNRIEQSMSPYIASSELSMVNQKAAQKTVKVSEELFKLLKQAQQIANLTQGAFDITYASVGYHYDYRAKQKPNENTIQTSLDAINYRAVKLDDNSTTVTFSHPKTKIDLGGIAKGHAIKQAINLLKDAGVEHALVSAGGDTLLLGDRVGRPWLIGIKHPRAEDKTAVRLPLENEAISTSGDYERYFIEDGQRYHHIINPQTGDSARKVVSVSVIGPDATYTDALSTAVFVLGLQDGMNLVNRLKDFEAVIIDNQQTMHFSTGLQTN
ncbi:FAD:protein FMN transferase [Shewanella maritima]|uniref:FAD:protein FMN transferase n=2 Tax=Shewanella maritima TaxID=2520507 RepID=A0A411PMJ7_9GAMM|nr:FAD:protein FMN transferase [Shewanella maritima]